MCYLWMESVEMMVAMDLAADEAVCQQQTEHVPLTLRVSKPAADQLAAHLPPDLGQVETLVGSQPLEEGRPDDYARPRERASQTDKN